MFASLSQLLTSPALRACVAYLLTRRRFGVPLLAVSIACIALTWVGVPVDYPIPTAQIKKERDHEYSFRLRWYGWPLRIAADANNVLGDYALYEDDRALGPSHSSIAAILAHGAGHYVLWRHRLYFSASDNTDPRANGRNYLLATRAYLPPAYTLFVMTLLLGVILTRTLRTLVDDRFGLKRRNRATRASTLLVVGSIDIILLLTWLFLPKAALDITPDLMSHQFGHAFEVSKGSGLPTIYKFMAEPTGLLHLERTVFEDGNRLGPTTISPQSIRDTGHGRNRYIDNRMVFSSTDNRDPRTNGREYRLEVRGQSTPLAVFLLSGNLLVLLLYQQTLWKTLARTGRTLRRLPAPLFALLFPTTTCLISHCLLYSRFVTNDDVANRAFLSGVFFLFEEDSSRYTFLAAPLATTLAPLVDFFSQYGVDFFSLFLTLCVFVAHMLLMLLARETRVSDALYPLVGGIVGILFLPFYTNLQFTISSALLVISSFFYLTRQRDEPHYLGPVRASCALICLAVGSLIRPVISFFYVLLSAMWVTYELLFLDSVVRRKRVVYVTLGLVVATAIPLGGRLLMSNAEHWQYNTLRATLLEHTPRDVLVDEELLRRASVDWSSNDYALFKKWFFFDRTLYSTENLKKLLTEIRDASDPRKRVARGVEVMQSLLQRPTIRWGLMCLLFATLAGFSRRMTVAAVLLPILALCTLVALGVATKPPPHRVTLPILGALSAAMLIFACKESLLTQREVKKRWALPLQTAVFFGLLFSSVFFLHASVIALGATWRLERQDNEQVEAQRRLLADPELVWIVTELAFPFEKLWRPWERDWSQGDFRFVWIGLHQHAIEVQRFVEREADGDIVDYMCTKDNVLLIAVPSLVELLRTLIKERYGSRFLIERHKGPDAGLHIWHCRRA